jgi:hypothetical protein
LNLLGDFGLIDVLGSWRALNFAPLGLWYFFWVLLRLVDPEHDFDVGLALL